MLKTIKEYVRLMRIRHWIKNFLLFLPAFFAGRLFETAIFSVLVPGFFAMSLYSSAVYVFNDLCDAPQDRQNERKRERPIAKGTVSGRAAVILIAVLIILASLLNLTAYGFSLPALLPLVFLIFNIGYSAGLKNVPILDLVILVSGYIIRIFYGSLATGIGVSGWFFMTIVALSFFLAFGKRRNEKRSPDSASRPVLARYTETFLTEGTYLFLALFITFYALWSMHGEAAISPAAFTVPLVIVIALRYSHDIEKGGGGDPVGVIFSDIVLWILGAGYLGFMTYLIYSGGAPS